MAANKKETFIQSVMEKTGWNQEKAILMIEDAVERIGISYRDYDRFNYFDIPVEKQKEAYAELLKRRNARAKHKERELTSVMRKTGWDRDTALEYAEEARKRLGISIGIYNKYNFWEIPAEQQEEEYRKIQEQYKKENESKLSESRAVNQRKAFIQKEKIDALGSTIAYIPLKKEEFKEIINKAQTGFNLDLEHRSQPLPVRAACTILGLVMPKDATCDKFPSDYIFTEARSLEQIQEILGKERLPLTPSIRKLYKEFEKKFKLTDIDHSPVNLMIYFTDWVLYCMDYGMTVNDYFEFKFFFREQEERICFLTNGYRRYVKNLCNTDIRLFMDKQRFNSYYTELVRRPWLDTTECTLAEFEQYIEKVPRTFAKRIAGGGGVGACILNKEDFQSPADMLAYCKEQGFLLEEIIPQHRYISGFNASTVNCIRLYTLVDANDEVQIMGTMIKFGRSNTVIDNVHGGGVGAIIDPESGIIVSNAIDRTGRELIWHPDSGMVFKGFKVPYWEKLKREISAGAMKSAAKNRHIGWDVSITENGDIEVVEGNSRPDFDLMQTGDQIGKLNIYYDKINELADRFLMPQYQHPMFKLISVEH